MVSSTSSSESGGESGVNGDTIYTAHLQFSERLNQDGTIGERLNVGDIIYTTTGAKLAETSGVVQFSPAFTYGGFQYCQMTLTTTNVPGSLLRQHKHEKLSSRRARAFVATQSSLTAHFTHADVPVVGQIEFSSDLLNTIQKMLHYTSLSNLQDVPTDCPTRERAGWTGDGKSILPAAKNVFVAFFIFFSVFFFLFPPKEYAIMPTILWAALDTDLCTIAVTLQVN